MKNILNHLRDKTVLITGGTMGIGLATGLEFAKLGAVPILTYKWGSADLEKIKHIFRSNNAIEPVFIRSDVAQTDDITTHLREISGLREKIDIFVSNVAFAMLTKSLGDWSERGLFKSIEYCVWPTIEITQHIKNQFGEYPRYVIGLSSNGPDHWHVNYDFIASSKGMLETLIKYINYHLFNKVKINIVRTRFVKTNSLWATCGIEFEEFGNKYNMHGLFIEPEEVAKGIVGLCSGLMDGVSGQVIVLDKGSTFADNIMYYYDERSRLGL